VSLPQRFIAVIENIVLGNKTEGVPLMIPVVVLIEMPLGKGGLTVYSEGDPPELLGWFGKIATFFSYTAEKVE
jgi:hypothetical protein